MCIESLGLEVRGKKKQGIILGIAFLGVSVFSYENQNDILAFVLGIVACTATILIVADIKENKVFNFLSKYTMPIFLMHTLFAAPTRTILLKLGISNAAVHIVVGIGISIIGPIVAIMILEKLKPLDFIVYPRRYVKI